MTDKQDRTREGGLFGDLPAEVDRSDTRTVTGPAGAGREPITVSALMAHVRDVLEHRFPTLRVVGEISNLTFARSGHVYFVLKDAASQVRCVMFRHRASVLARPPRDGDRVEVRASIAVYEPRGDLQLNVESMRASGAGALYEAFVALRERLEREGLFDDALKRPPPALPRRIGVITSPQGAALRDVLSALARRNPAIEVVIYPTQVQGTSAAGEITRMLRIASARGECDVLLLTRGGGSIEDLWAFNDEGLARAIRAASIPVVTGVGHQTDFTIADFAADVRAATPTAAAELLSPSRGALLARIGEVVERLNRRTWSQLEARMQRLDSLMRRLAHPRERLHAQQLRLHHALRLLRTGVRRNAGQARAALTASVARLQRALPSIAPRHARLVDLARRPAIAQQTAIDRARQRVSALERALAHLDPSAVLARGYSITTDERGNVVHEASSISVGQALSVRLARGVLKASVTSKQ